MDPIEIIVTSVDSLSSSPSQASYQSSPNGRSTQYKDQKQLNMNMNSVSNDITAKSAASYNTAVSTASAPSIAATSTSNEQAQLQRISTDRWHSTRLGGYDSASDDHKNDDNNKKPLLSLSMPNSQSSTSLYTTKSPKQASAHHSIESAGRLPG